MSRGQIYEKNIPYIGCQWWSEFHPYKQLKKIVGVIQLAMPSSVGPRNYAGTIKWGVNQPQLKETSSTFEGTLS